METPAQAPIGIFDSGVGGLSIVDGIARELPHENMIYLADSAFAPYGDKSDREIRERTEAVVDGLIRRGAKAIVIACNTATAAAVKQLRSHHNLPIIGVEPGVKPAVMSTKTGKVGILATQYTVESEKFRLLIEPYLSQAKLCIKGCPGLVETLEQPGDHRDKLIGLLRRYLEPMIEADVDRLVLGCTHYSFLIEEIRTLLPEQVEVIDTPGPVAREVRRRLLLAGLLNSDQSLGVHQYFSTSKEIAHSTTQFRRLLGFEASVTHLKTLEEL